MGIPIQLCFKNLLCHVILNTYAILKIINVLHGVRINLLHRTYVFLATRRGKWMALSQIIGFVYTYHLIAYTGSHSTVVSPHVSTISIACVKCERRVQYNCTLSFDTLLTRHVTFFSKKLSAWTNFYFFSFACNITFVILLFFQKSESLASVSGRMSDRLITSR